jgi:hypothetical protein
LVDDQLYPDAKVLVVDDIHHLLQRRNTGLLRNPGQVDDGHGELVVPKMEGRPLRHAIPKMLHRALRPAVLDRLAAVAHGV